MIITIDGPTGSGKSTLGRMLAKYLHYYYLCSGLLFRALAYLLINKEIYKEEKLRNPSADDVRMYLNKERLQYCYDDAFQERIFFDKIDLTPHLKNFFIDKMTSILSENALVRKLIINRQRDIAYEYKDIVVDGRDSGSIVFSNATIKFFITAPLEIRADRWRNQQEKLGNRFSQKRAMEIVHKRDERDESRKIDPLIIPDDALVIDNSYANEEDALKNMLLLMQRDFGF